LPFEHWSGCLSDWPDHSEIADGCANGTFISFKNRYLITTYGQCPCGCQANNACADDDCGTFINHNILFSAEMIAALLLTKDFFNASFIT